MAIGVRLPELDEMRGVAIRQLAPQHGVDDAEDGGRGADADGERQRGDDREPGAPSQHAEAVRNVLRHHVETPMLLQQLQGVRDGAGAEAHGAARGVPQLGVPLTAPLSAPPARHEQACAPHNQPREVS